MNPSSGLGQEQLCLFVMTQTNNPISLPADIKVSLFSILCVLFGLRAVYVFAAVWVIAFWISSSDKQPQLFRCSYAPYITQSQIVVFGLLASCEWHLQHECDWIQSCISNRDWVFETHSAHRNPLQQREAGSPRTARHHKGFRTPSVSAFITLRWWGAGHWDRGEEVWVLVVFGVWRPLQVMGEQPSASLSWTVPQIISFTSHLWFPLSFPKTGTERRNKSREWCQIEGGETKNIFPSNWEGLQYM